jgi:hypothetical protein
MAYRKMPQQTNYRILVRTAEAGAFSLTKVLNAPRLSTPVDLKAACASFEFVPQSEDVPNELTAFGSFVLTDFFALAHRTGLYNRQRNLWDSVGRINEILCTRPQTGLFIKVNQPFVDLNWVDNRGNTLIFGSLLDKDLSTSSSNNISRFVNKAIERAGRVQKRQGYLFGVFLALQEDIPVSVQAMIDRLTQAEDMVARYESRLPPPLSVPLNVLRLELDQRDNGAAKLRLAHPNLKSEEASKLVQAG